MAHDRLRSIRPLYDKLINATPILGIFGHRQVGKTTFMTQVTTNYLTFDSFTQKKLAERDPERFVRSLKKAPFGAVGPVGIDECQLVPELFPALKEYTRTKRSPGQFILSGSVRFTSRKAIRESLTGRMMFFELYPLIISELDQRVLPDFFVRVIEWKKFSDQVFQHLSPKESSDRIKSIDHYLEKGGLPGLCFLREPRLVLTQLDDLHRLMLDRDLRMVHETKLSLDVLSSFLRVIARMGWQGYSQTLVKEELGLSPVTQKSLLFALESIFLIRRVPISGGKKGEIILLEDQLEERVLSEGAHSQDERLSSLVYRNLRAQFQYRLGLPISMSSYWTKNNARVPLVINCQGNFLGVISIDSEEPTLSQLRAADSLLRAEGNSKVIILSRTLRRSMIINSRTALVPLGMSI